MLSPCRISQLTRLVRPSFLPLLAAGSGSTTIAASLSHSLSPAHRFPSTANMASGSVMASADDRNRRTIHTAACLIIGDEVLGGKTVDTNSAFLAKFCFRLGINLKRIEVVEDDESEIVEAVCRMSDRYDFVVTSGGIGPTHDDITYESVAKAFGLPLVLHDDSYVRMKKLMKAHPGQSANFSWDEESPARTARLRMVTLPHDTKREPKSQVLFPSENLWVPIAVVNGNVHILPGVPRLFQQLLSDMEPFLRQRLADPEGNGTVRILISTPMPESSVAGYLAELAERVAARGVKVGSYPRWEKKTNTVTLTGKDQDFLESLVPEVVEKVNGRRITVEGEDDGEATSAGVNQKEV